MQSKIHAKHHFLRFVETDKTIQDKDTITDKIYLEADKIEALNGPNPYSDFLRKNGYRPSREQASVIGRLMGARVRANDGSMQPMLTPAERDAIRSIRKRRREWAERIEHVDRTVAAITALAENNHEPSAVLSYGTDVFFTPDVRQKIDSALEWLSRFAKESQRHGDQNSRSKGPTLVSSND